MIDHFSHPFLYDVLILRHQILYKMGVQDQKIVYHEVVLFPLMGLILNIGQYLKRTSWAVITELWYL